MINFWRENSNSQSDFNAAILVKGFFWNAQFQFDFSLLITIFTNRSTLNLQTHSELEMNALHVVFWNKARAEEKEIKKSFLK